MKTKAEKLIDRGSEDEKVASAAAAISEMLIRMYLNQPRYFAEAVGRAIPQFTIEDATKLRDFFERVAKCFDAEAKGQPVDAQEVPHNLPAIRQWEMGDGVYNIQRVFAVLSCDLPYCAEHMGCWETRRAFCQMDGKPQPRA